MLSIMQGLPANWTTEAGFKLLDQAIVAGGSPADIADAGVQMTSLLLIKNAAYGDSALSPIEVFARGLPVSQRMAVRMDDKISRIWRGHEMPGDNDKIDLAGYLLLDYIATHRPELQ